MTRSLTYHSDVEVTRSSLNLLPTVHISIFNEDIQRLWKLKDLSNYAWLKKHDIYIFLYLSNGGRIDINTEDL